MLVALQGATHFLKLRPLAGAYTAVERPKFSPEAFLSGTWQHEVDRYLKDHHGFREPAIRLYNQYLWTAYHSSTNRGSVVIGKDDYLFEPYFVDEYYTGCFRHFYPDSSAYPNPDEVFAKRMSRLSKLQAILEEQGVHLFLALLPGKERIYPEYLPAYGDRPRDTGDVCRAYDHYSGAAPFDLRRIDLCRYFDSLRGRTPYLLFTQLGTHWSNIACTYAFDSVLRYMGGFGPPIRPVTLGQPYYARTREPDADLDDLLNKTFRIRTERNLYVDVALSGPAPARKPSFIVIGDSFFWTVLYNYPVQELFDHFRYWYYFSTIYYDDDHDHVANIDLVGELLDADYVMLSYCTVQLYNLGNGFIDRALLEICYNPDEIQAVRDSLAADSASPQDVDRRMEQNLEQYFPALGEELPSRRSDAFAAAIRQRRE